MPPKTTKQEVAVAEPILGTQLATIDLATYALMKMPLADVMEAVRENIGSGISEFDFDRVSVPAGGGITWEIEGLEGTETTQEIQGVIVHMTEPRAFWRESFDASGGGTPPDCSSSDGEVGMGDPGGSCANCALSKFGSAPAKMKNGKEVESRGQACKQMRRVFVVVEGSILPLIVSAPPTSLKNFRNYLFRLSGKALPYYKVVTGFKLVKQQNKDGIAYSMIAPRVIGTLNPEQQNKIADYRQAIVGAMSTMDLSSSDYQRMNEGGAQEAQA